MLSIAVTMSVTIGAVNVLRASGLFNVSVATPFVMLTVTKLVLELVLELIVRVCHIGPSRLPLHHGF